MTQNIREKASNGKPQFEKELREFHELAAGVACVATVTRDEFVRLLSQAALRPGTMDAESIQLLEAVLRMLADWRPGGLCLACDTAPPSLAKIGAFAVISSETAGAQAIVAILCEKCASKKDSYKICCEALRRNLWPGLREIGEFGHA